MGDEYELTYILFSTETGKMFCIVANALSLVPIPVTCTMLVKACHPREIILLWTKRFVGSPDSRLSTPLTSKVSNSGDIA